MKKLLISIAAIAAISSAAMADSPIFNEDDVAECLAPNGSISNCYDDALGADEIGYGKKYGQIKNDRIAYQTYKTINETGCNRGVAIDQSGAKISESDRRKTGRMCMERGVFYLDEYNLRKAGWENAKNLIEESMEYLKKAKIHPDTSREYSYGQKKQNALLPEVEWQLMQIKNDADCSAGNGMACVNWGKEQLKKYPNKSSYSDRSEAESFQKGINAGEPTAYYALAGLYLLDQKGNEAIGLLEKGCKAGHALACKKGAGLLFLGENGVTINVDRAGQMYADACRLDPTDVESCANAPKKPEPKPATKEPTNKKIAKKAKK